ncbi:DLW-39 family protein [Desertihabitans aurantiacus]|uniref:DLW-39 family protein n=1 Tax=Desertihabitans aurantiacus TaxID=2282477 RepID=UPI0018E539A4|nr:DLW-39 family protein [Desertihabitans aurantiacus]
MKAPLLILLSALVAVVTTVLVRQNRRAAAEAELWAEATDPLPRTSPPADRGR